MTENINKAGAVRGSVLIHTTSAAIGTALSMLEDAREQLLAGDSARTVDAQLYLVHEQLSGIILRAIDADAAVCTLCLRTVGPASERDRLLFKLRIGGMSGNDHEICQQCADGLDKPQQALLAAAQAERARRDADDYQSLAERMHEIRGHEAALKGRITTALEFKHIIEDFDR